ncbi:MAG: ATP-binding cassette domain-containing protein, partial [Balneolaceae bacterium]
TGSIEWHLRSGICSGLNMLGNIGFAAPYVELYETLTLQENLRFLHDLYRGESPTSIADLLIRFQAESFAGRLYGDLSTGQRQRAKLAAAVIHRPEILCLDEPGANLDEEGRTLVQSTINRFTEEGKMVLIASNQPGELALCQQTINLDIRSDTG